ITPDNEPAGLVNAQLLPGLASPAGQINRLLLFCNHAGQSPGGNRFEAGLAVALHPVADERGPAAFSCLWGHSFRPSRGESKDVAQQLAPPPERLVKERLALSDEDVVRLKEETGRGGHAAE